MEHEEIELFYQPLVDIRPGSSRSKRCCAGGTPARIGFSARVHSAGGRDGLIVPIGAWVLKQACARAATWPSHIKVSVNLSPVQFKSNTLVLNVISALNASSARSDKAGARDQRRVTGDAVAGPPKCYATLLRLRELGVSI